MSDHVCPVCQKAWTHQPRPGLRAAGFVIVGLSVVALLAMLFFLKEGNTTVGGGAAVAAMVCLGLGMKLNSKTLVRCPDCGAAPAP